MSHLAALIQLRLAVFKNACNKLRRSSPVEFAAIALFFIGLAGVFYFLFLKCFTFFQNHKPFGPILIDETFYLFNFTLFVMLILSSAISAYASLFKSGEVPFLLTRSVAPEDIYFSKLLETLWFSARPFLFILIPFMTAFGMIRNMNPWSFIPVCLGFYLAFILLTVSLGNLAALLCVWLLPSKKQRQAALLAAILWGIWLLIRSQPEVVREQGSLAGILTGYLPHVAFAKYPWLPSCWITQGILAFAQASRYPSLLGQSLFCFLLVLANALFILVPSWFAGRHLFPLTFFSAQDHGQIRKSGQASSFDLDWLDGLPGVPRPAMAFLEKDLKTFSREASEWSQLFIFFVLLLLYFLNLRNFQFHVLKDSWKDIIFVLNTTGIYIILSSFSMRFVFPSLSLEGSRAWILAVSPVRWITVLWEKFFSGLTVSALLTLPLVFLSGWMLEIETRRVIYATVLGGFVCLALTGLSVGLGAAFPNFKSNNPSQIISGVGGTILLVTHLLYIGALAYALMLYRQIGLTMLASVAAASIVLASVSLVWGARQISAKEF